MKVLITGVAGFVGSTLARHLLNIEGIEVVGVDDLSFGYRNRLEDIRGDFVFMECDVRTLASREIADVDCVVHCAAIAPLPNNQEDHYESLNRNVALCGAVIDFCTANGVRKLVHFSSGAIYEGICQDGTPIRETMTPEPQLMYPVSKYLSEQYLSTQAKVYDIEVVALRLFNLYGPHQDYWRKQLPLIGYIVNSIINGNPMTFFAAEEARRDYVHIDDLAALVYQIITAPITPGLNPLNVCSGEAFSVYDIVELFESIVGAPLSYSRGLPSELWNKFPSIFNRKLPFPEQLLSAETNKVAVGDNSKAQTLYNWKPSVSMANGLRGCYTFGKEILQ